MVVNPEGRKPENLGFSHRNDERRPAISQMLNVGNIYLRFPLNVAIFKCQPPIGRILRSSVSI